MENKVFSKNIKSVALVNDMSGLGRCSLTVAIPIISSLGLQPVPIPTAILSCHTAYPSYYFKDFSPYFADYINSLNNQVQKVDALYTGFMGSETELDVITSFVQSNKLFTLVDPVMGDHGKAYSTYNKAMCDKMKHLVALSDVTTPNITEACLLTDAEYKENFNDDELIDIAKAVCSLGAKVCIITGIVRNNIIQTLVYKANGEHFVNVNERTEIMYDGTGDIFASVLCGKLLCGNNLESSVKSACDFVSRATQYTTKLGTPPLDGIAFEPLLKDL